MLSDMDATAVQINLQRLSGEKDVASGFFDLVQLSTDELPSAREAQLAYHWLLQKIATEVLRYSIEDDRVNCRFLAGLSDPMTHLFGSLDQKSPTDVFESIGRILESLRELPKVGAHLKDVNIPALRGGLMPIKAWISDSDKELIPVSSKLYPFMPNLDDSVSDPNLRRTIVNRFVDELKDLQTQYDATCLGFIQKTVGPIGALALASDLAHEVGLPWFAFREGYWLPDTQIAGSYKPGPDDKVIIVYDLYVTGGGIRHAVTSIASQLRAKTVGAVIFFTYGPQPQTIEVGGEEITIRSLAQYRDVEPHIKRLRKDDDVHFQKRHLVSLQHRKAPRLPVYRGKASALPQLRGEKEMPNSAPEWRASFNAYNPSELSAMVFDSIEEFDRAIELCWEDKRFKNMPRYSPDGMSLFVPNEAPSLFKAQGVKFREKKVRGMGDLSAETRDTLRSEQHM